MQSAGGIFSTYIASSPLWLKLIIGGSLLLYIYIQRKWTALNDCGIDVLTPKERICVSEFAFAIFFRVLNENKIYIKIRIKRFGHWVQWDNIS